MSRGYWPLAKLDKVYPESYDKDYFPELQYGVYKCVICKKSKQSTVYFHSSCCGSMRCLDCLNNYQVHWNKYVCFTCHMKKTKQVREYPVECSICDGLIWDQKLDWSPSVRGKHCKYDHNICCVCQDYYNDSQMPLDMQEFPDCGACELGERERKKVEKTPETDSGSDQIDNGTNDSSSDNSEKE